MDSLGPLRTAVEDLFRNSVLFVVLNTDNRAVSIRASRAAAVPMCLSRNYTRGVWTFIDKVLSTV